MARMPDTSERLITLADDLTERLSGLVFDQPVTHVYNPLVYARRMHVAYLRRFARAPKRVVFVGMNPGPFGMTQTGVPFGEIAAVRDWMGLNEPIDRPKPEHPKRPVEGLKCPRSEVSGKRLWGLFAGRFGSADEFFRDHFVANYCPLVFMDESARNVTPDKLSTAQQQELFKACDDHLRGIVESLKPEWVVGIGAFAEERIVETLAGMSKPPRLGRVLHPSPSSPAANRGWAGIATGELMKQGIWLQTAEKRASAAE
jgi:single-strand selective monofunctional uracil DNA glycosylase